VERPRLHLRDAGRARLTTRRADYLRTGVAACPSSCPGRASVVRSSTIAPAVPGGSQHQVWCARAGCPRILQARAARRRSAAGRIDWARRSRSPVHAPAGRCCVGRSQSKHVASCVVPTAGDWICPTGTPLRDNAICIAGMRLTGTVLLSIQTCTMSYSDSHRPISNHHHLFGSGFTGHKYCDCLEERLAHNLRRCARCSRTTERGGYCIIISEPRRLLCITRLATSMTAPQPRRRLSCITRLATPITAPRPTSVSPPTPPRARARPTTRASKSRAPRRGTTTPPAQHHPAASRPRDT
jgi:hypothetical protein